MFINTDSWDDYNIDSLINHNKEAFALSGMLLLSTRWQDNIF